MQELQVPYDEWAERAVVGCAVATRRGADLARARIAVDDLFNPKHQLLFRAALEVEDDDQEDRLQAVATSSCVSAVELEQLVDQRPTMWDKSGSFASRVSDAARRRAVMTFAARIYNELGRGARLAEVASEVHEIERAVSC